MFQCSIWMSLKEDGAGMRHKEKNKLIRTHTVLTKRTSKFEHRELPVLSVIVSVRNIRAAAYKKLTCFTFVMAILHRKQGLLCDKTLCAKNNNFSMMKSAKADLGPFLRTSSVFSSRLFYILKQLKIAQLLIV